jgi:hypothetical protein
MKEVRGVDCHTHLYGHGDQQDGALHWRTTFGGFDRARLMSV